MRNDSAQLSDRHRRKDYQIWGIPLARRGDAAGQSGEEQTMR